MSAYIKECSIEDEEHGLKASTSREPRVGCLRRQRKTLLIASSVIVAIIVIAGVSVRYVQEQQRLQATAAAQDPSSQWQLQPGLQPGSTSPPTLLITFNNSRRDALELIPPVLMPFVQRTNLTTSLMQLLQFDNEDVMQAALRYIQYFPEVSYLVRDFEMFLPEGADSAGLPAPSPGTANSSSGTSARKLTQDSDSTNGGSAAASTASNDPMLQFQWYLDKIQAPAAWQAFSSGSEIIVAVVDTGVDLTHPDLVDHLWINPREIPNNGIDDDGNGYVDDVHGFNFNGACKDDKYDSYGQCQQCTSSGDPVDIIGHGSHVAGIIAAIKNNNQGVAGVAPRVKVMALKILDCRSSIFTSSVFQAFDYAMNMGAHVVSCSFGGKFAKSFVADSPAPSIHAGWTEAYRLALQPLADKGILLVAAAGNDDINLDLLQKYGYAYNPCLAPVANVLCIMSTTQRDERSSFSNYGTKTTQMASPGNDILSTYKYGAYRYLNGTSMATPIVSGAAAMMLSAITAQGGSPLGRAQELKELLQSSGDLLPGLPTKSSRRLNVMAAVTAAAQLAGASAVAARPVKLDVAGSAAMLRGVRETYFDLKTVKGNISSTWAAVDTSIREAVFPLAGFKRSAGVLLQLSGLMELPAAGSYAIQVTGGSEAVAVLVNGQELQVRPGSSKAHFQAKSPGWYVLSIRVPGPSKPISVQMQQPGADAFGPLPALWQLGTRKQERSAGLLQTQVVTAGHAFVVQYSAVPASGNVSASQQAIVAAAAAGTLPNLADFDSTAVLPSLDLGSGQLQQALYPTVAGQPAGTVLGLATARLRAQASGTCLRFKVKCECCTLWLNGLMLVDLWEAAPGGAPVAKASGPVNLTAAGPHKLELTFSTTKLEAAVLVLQWAPCSAPADAAALTSTAGIDSSAVWQPEQLMTGWLGGVQCDVWQSDAINQLVPPSYKFRLPDCPGPWHQASDSCQLPLIGTLGEMLPGLGEAQPGSRFSVRCWSYSSREFHGPLVAGPEDVHSRVWLAGAEVFRSSPAAAALGSSLRSDKSNSVPLRLASPGAHYKLLVTVWVNVSNTAVLQLADGQGVLLLNQAAWRLPVAPALPAGSSLATVGSSNVAALLADYPISQFPAVVARPGSSQPAGQQLQPSSADAEQGTQAAASPGIAWELEGDSGAVIQQGSGDPAAVTGTGDGSGAGADALEGVQRGGSSADLPVELGLASSSTPAAPEQADGSSSSSSSSLTGAAPAAVPGQQQQQRLSLSAGHVSIAYTFPQAVMVPDILLPYTSASTTLLGTYSKQAAGLTDISAAYTMERQGPWYSRCVGLWQLQLQAPSLVTLNISQPAGQAMQVTLGDVTVHSMVPGPGTATGAASSSSQLMLLPGVYLMDVVARPAPGAANVSFSISMMAAQEQGWAGQEQGAISAAAWQSLVAG